MTVNAARIGVSEGKILGAAQHRPWWHCTHVSSDDASEASAVSDAVVDAYERVNVWSHGIPGSFFLLLG